MVIVEIPIGPQHPALHEPIMLRVRTEGEEVVEVAVNTGYNHRGIEKLLEKNSWIRGMYIAGRVCGICNAVHIQAYVQGVEKLMGVEPLPRANYIRTIVMELERIHSHMLISAVMAEIIGFDTLFMLLMRDRERIMYLKELVTGSRVHADIHTVGGVKRDLDEVRRDKILSELEKVEERLKYYKNVYENDYTIVKRLSEVGTISKSNALKMSVVGPTLRGSGVRSDVRSDDPYAAYPEISFNVVVRDEGDSWARMIVRLEEALESVNIIRHAIESLPQGPAIPKTIPRSAKPGEAISRVEAPRGELIYHLVSVGGPNPYRVKIRTPSFMNILNTDSVYLGHRLADVPVIFASYDPCISCTERVVVIDEKTGEKTYMNLRELARVESR
ncbi:MAG: nickel-dependent hydrogenase large subunit [Sulfolobales archaeon]|nr:nickel-dependent hydrogenase large subunit [Sulfolobales archaeon]MDW8083339.1 nickel-dependent hydrogenase large subunit [Sulfolobales archaeon]